MIILLTGCTSLVEKSGQVLDGSAFAEKKTALYQNGKKSPVKIQEMQNKAGEKSYLIMMQQFPAMKIRCSAPNSEGEMDLLSLEYLGGNTNGWNEYRLDLYGHGNLSLNNTSATLSLSEEVEAVQISWGRIRRYENRLSGDEALTGLRNRRERIVALSEWMNSIEGNPALDSRKDFENHWKPILFPETVSKKKKPQNWQQENDQFSRAEDINWNISYTNRIFPELLHEVRNTGTMLRDWEEAVEWLYIEYEWERIMKLLSLETVLYKAKR